MQSLPLLLGLLVSLAGCATPPLDVVPTVATGSVPVPARPTEAPSHTAANTAETAVPQWQLADEWQFRWESLQGKGTFVSVIQREEMVDGVAYYVEVAGQREIYVRKTDLAEAMEKVQGAIESRNVPPRLVAMWPLTLGKQWTQTYIFERPRLRDTVEVTQRCQVEAMETLTVPAGTFRTSKIGCYNQRTGALVYESWYAPAVKYWIRQRIHGPVGILERELLAFKLH